MFLHSIFVFVLFFKQKMAYELRISDWSSEVCASDRIGFVLQGLGAGGSERIVSLLCNHFAAQGWTVTLFAFEDRDTTPYYPHHPAVRIMPLGMKSEKMPLFGALKAVRARVELHRKGLEVAPPHRPTPFP